MDILFAFTPEQPILDVPALQLATRLTRPTLYRLLRTLQRKGVIHAFGEPKRFQVGYRISALAPVWERTFPLVSIARPLLERLAKATGETVALMVAISPSERVCALELKSSHAISFSRGVGYKVRMDKGASGKVILAFWRGERLTAALQVVDADSRDTLRRQLSDIRRSGTAVTYGEIYLGAMSIAAPVTDASGEAVASICVFSPANRMHGKTLATTKRLVLGAAREASAELGRGR